jgi:phosphoesterase RecJ-like protein
MNKLSEISKIIKQSKTFFIAGHVKPDGDSLGSACALAKMLQRMGKKAEVYCADDIPQNLSCIKGIAKVKKEKPENVQFDCAILLESLDFQRMGDIINPSQAKKIINIDHHRINSNFGDVNYVIADSSSVCELVLNIFEYMKIKPSKDEAYNLYVGLLTDSGKFQNSNVTANSHIAAAKLIELGAPIIEISRKIYSNETIQSLRILSMALLGLKTMFDQKLVYMTITKKMLNDAEAKDEDTGGIVSYPLRLRQTKVSCLLKEEGKNSTKLSMRSVKEFNLLPIVKKLGGGGHKNAAGATINKSIKESRDLLKKIFKELK